MRSMYREGEMVYVAEENQPGNSGTRRPVVRVLMQIMQTCDDSDILKQTGRVLRQI